MDELGVPLFQETSISSQSTLVEIRDILHQLSDFAGAPPCKVGKAVNLYYDRSSRAPSAAASAKRPATASIFEPRQ